MKRRVSYGPDTSPRLDQGNTTTPHDARRRKGLLTLVIACLTTTIAPPQAFAQDRAHAPRALRTGKAKARRARAPLPPPLAPSKLRLEASFSGLDEEKPVRAAGEPWGEGVPMGLETEPLPQDRVLREGLFLMSRLTGVIALRQAALSEPRGGLLRVTLASELDERERRRATYIDTKELEGSTPRPLPLATTIALGAGGGALFAIACTIPRFISLGENVSVAPQPWPMGFNLGGTFDIP